MGKASLVNTASFPQVSHLLGVCGCCVFLGLSNLVRALLAEGVDITNRVKSTEVLFLQQYKLQ